MKGAAKFSCFALTLILLTIGEAISAELRAPAPNQSVEVRVLSDGRYLYKGKEITARELMRLGEHKSIDFLVSKDFLAKDPLFKEMQEQAQRNGAYHIGFSGVESKQIDPPTTPSNVVIPGRAKP